MELHDIKEIREIAGANGVNAYLAEGWVILNSVTEHEGDSGWIKYSLGWPKDLPAVHPNV